MLTKRYTPYTLHYTSGYHRWWTGFGVDTPHHHSPLTAVSTGRIAWIICSCWLTLIPRLSSRSNRVPYLPPRELAHRLGSWASAAAHSQHSPSYVCTVSSTARGCASQPPPLFRWLERQFYRACFFVWAQPQFIGCLDTVAPFFFLPQRLQSLQLLKRRRWAGWRSCMRASQWRKKREHLIKLHARKNRSAIVCSFSLP